MFTGLIEDIGEVTKVTGLGSGKQFTFKTAIPVEEIGAGDSIAVDGVCLTVSDFVDGGFKADVSPESLKRSTLRLRKTGHRVNLERALRLSDRLGGHLVSGHVDGSAVLTAIEKKDDFIRLVFTAPPNIMRYVIEKGSVTLDGVSLTVNSCSDKTFAVMIIPHTYSHTTLHLRKKGDPVNVENDVIGKYVEKLMTGTDSDKTGVTEAFLAKYDFM